MATYYKGAALATHWHKNDARIMGFSAVAPAQSHSRSAMIKHVVQGTNLSPYISITRSWMLAKEYAMLSRIPGVRASASQPAYIYEMDISKKAATLFDTIIEVSKSLPGPYSNFNYSHNCDRSLIAAIVQGNLPSYLSTVAVAGPPNSNNPVFSPTVTDELRAMLLALRDAEILALHAIPAATIVARHDIW